MSDSKMSSNTCKYARTSGTGAVEAGDCTGRPRGSRMSRSLGNLGKVLALALLAVLVTLVFSPASARAAGNTWLPPFDPAKHVYVAPALANHPTHPFKPDEQFERALEQLAAKHQLSVYVIATEQGDDLSGERKRWAPDHLHNQVWEKWSSASGFNESRILLIEWVRSRDNPGMSSTAARAGSAVQAYGITRESFFDQSGPVFTAIRAYLPQDPRGCFLAIVSNVNRELDSYLTANNPPSGSSASQPSSETQFGVVVVVFCVFFGILVLIVIVGTNAATIVAAGGAGAVVGHVLTSDDPERMLSTDIATSWSAGSDSTPIITGEDHGQEFDL